MKERNEMLTTEDAEAKLALWADHMELDTSRSLYDDLVEELRMSVKKQRMTFDVESETFRYQLIKPVNGKNVVEIKECSFNDKKILQKYKETESIESARAMVSKYTNLSQDDVGELKDRDINKINAVIMGFLAQIAPSKK